MVYGMMDTNPGNWILIKLVGLAIASFVFSVIFWWTYRWMVKKK